MIFIKIGSRTAPPCQPGAYWIVFDRTVPISVDDVRIIRNSMMQSNSKLSKLGNNNRPRQLLNGRDVYYSKASPIDPEILQDMKFYISQEMSAKSCDNSATGIAAAALFFALLSFVLLMFLVYVLLINPQRYGPLWMKSAQSGHFYGETASNPIHDDNPSRDNQKGSF